MGTFNLFKNKLVRISIFIFFFCVKKVFFELLKLKQTNHTNLNEKPWQ